jgi:hypothetical protein
MTRALPALVLVAVVGCGSSQTALSGDTGSDAEVPSDASTSDRTAESDSDLPVCSGIVTADIGGGCDPSGSEWYHGEHTCPAEVTCGEVTDCVAYYEWPYGTCICPNPDYIGDLSFVEPADGAHLTSEDDVDPDTPGLQIEVVVDAGCWMDYDFEWSLTLGTCGDPHTEPEYLFEPDESGRASRIIDFNFFTGITRICAWPVKDGDIEWGAVVSVHVGT